MRRRHALASSFALFIALLAAALTPPPAGAIVGGTNQVSDSLTAPLAFIQIAEPTGLAGCSGTLIAPAVVMTAAHCVYETTKHGNLLGIASPSALAVRVGSRDVSNAALGVSVHVVAVLPQPYYRWDGTHHFHDVALLALDRPLAQPPAALAEQRPGAGKPLLIAGYGRSSTSDRSGPSELRIGQIDAADPATCHLDLGGVQPLLALLRQRCLRSPGRAGRDGLLRRFGGPCVRLREHGGQRRRRGSHQLRLGSRLRILALLPDARLERARLHRSSAWHATRLVEPFAGRPAHCHSQAGQSQGRPDGLPARADRRRQERSLARRHHVPQRRTAGRAGLPQRPHQSLGEVQAARRVEAHIRLDLRARNRRHEEAVEQGLCARRRSLRPNP